MMNEQEKACVLCGEPVPPYGPPVCPECTRKTHGGVWPGAWLLGWLRRAWR